jgi:acylphosphatase
MRLTKVGSEQTIVSRVAERHNPTAMAVRRRLMISGRVQGVFFRGAMRERARAAGVAGWARNLPDGTVEAVLEGEPEAVAGIVEFARSGPRHARVDGVDVSDEPPDGLTGFESR